MKFFLLLLLFPCFAHAQRHEWEKLNIDSATFASLYGSEKEFQIQTNDMLTSNSRWRVFFIGYKWAYCTNLIGFLEQRHWTAEKSSTDNTVKYVCKTYNNEKGYAAKLTLTFYLDDDERITKVIITGTPDDVIDLYLDYWEYHDLSFNEIKTKHDVYFNSVGDKVAFSWNATKPVITVTKSGIANFNLKENSK